MAIRPTPLRVVAAVAVVALLVGLASINRDEHDAVVVVVDEEAAETAAASARRVEEEERSIWIVEFFLSFSLFFFLSFLGHIRSKTRNNAKANLLLDTEKKLTKNVPRPAPPEGSPDGPGLVPKDKRRRSEQEARSPASSRRHGLACLLVVRLIELFFFARPRAALSLFVLLSAGL